MTMITIEIREAGGNRVRSSRESFMKEDGLKAERYDLAREEDEKDITPGKRRTEAMTRKQG